MLYTCRDECGAQVETKQGDPNAPPGWEYLPIIRRWRCPECREQLDAVEIRLGELIAKGGKS